MPIVSKEILSARADIKLAKESGADIVELRLDYLDNISESGLKQMIRADGVPKIVTLRRKKDGGNFRGTEKERQRILEKACLLGADYVDVEYDADFNMPAGALTKVICSYHDFERTPDVKGLLNTLELCLENEPRPDVVKIVTMATKYADNVTILEFLERARDALGDAKVVSFCMGEKGVLSRVLCTKFGSLLTFAALGKGKESAPGQVDIKVMKEFCGLML